MIAFSSSSSISFKYNSSIFYFFFFPMYNSETIVPVV